jgi:HK97 family phage major capsid protein
MVAAVASAVVLTETAAYSVVTPTINEVTFTAIKYGHLVKVSDELAADSAFPLAETIILPQMAQAFAAAENTEFTVGDGSGNPEGIVQALTAVSTASVAAGAATIISAVDCINLQHALPVQYRRGRKVAFMANDTIIRDLRLLTDNAGGAASLLSPTHSGNFLWQPGLREGTPDTLLGYPIHPNSSMDASAPAQNEESLIFGDWTFYWIAERGGLEMRFLPELYAGTGQVAWRGTKRVDGRCMQTAAFKVLRHP